MNSHLVWKKLSSEPVLTGPRPVERVKFLFPDGHESEYDIRQDADSSVVLAITPVEQVVLAKQFRPGKMEVLLEMPGGGIKTGQTAMEAAEAELREEVGYAGELEFVGQSWPDAYSTRKSNVFVARNCVRVGNQQLDPNEFIEIALISLEDFRKYIRTGKLTDVDAGYLALDHLGWL